MLKTNGHKRPMSSWPRRSRLTQSGTLGDRQWRALLDRHDEAVRQQIVRFRGRAVKSLGDWFLATFDGPARAARCTSAIVGAVQPLGQPSVGWIPAIESEWDPR